MDDPSRFNAEQNPYAAPSGVPHAAPLETIKPGSRIYPPLQYGFASRWKRFVGSIIDSLILVIGMGVSVGVFTFAVVFAFPELAELAEDFEAESIEFLVAGNVIALAGMALSFFLFNGYLLAKHGQTVGKAILGMRIVHEDGRIPSLTRVFFLRYASIWFLSMIPGVGNYLAIGSALAIFRATHKCLHDDFASTIVINTGMPVQQKTAHPEHENNWN